MNTIDWTACKLVVFDIDGTLYDPAPMRGRMALMLAIHAVTQRDPGIFSIISALRRRRETLAEAEQDDFLPILINETAARFKTSPGRIEHILSHWFDERPLPFIGRYVVPGAPQLFESLRSRNIVVGVLSDHRAEAKLHALGLSADHIVSAVDPDVGIQKPDPRGLEVLLNRAGFKANEAVMVGDRADRDGEIARRAGTGFLLRGKSADADFQRFDDPVFKPVLS